MLVGEYLFTDEAFVKHLSVEHRNVFEKIYDEIKHLMKLVTAGSKEARALEQMKHAFESAYREGRAQKNTVKDGEVRYSISPTLDSDLDAVLNGTFNADKSEVYLGETSNFMTNVIGAQSLSKTMPASKVYAAMVTRAEYEKNPRYKEQPHYHGLGKDKVLEILEKSENPIAAFADTPDAEGNSRLNRIVLVTDAKVADTETGGEGYAVVIEEVDTRGWLNNKRVNVNKDITIYPMDRVDMEIQRAIADKRILDIKKQGQSLAGLHGAISQTAIQDTVLKNNIANFWANVKWKNEKNKTFSSDSPEKTLSPVEAALQKAGLLDQDGHTQSMQNSKNDARDVEALSLSSANEDIAPVGDFATPANELRYEGDVSDDIAPAKEGEVDGGSSNRHYEITSDSAMEKDNIANGRKAISNLISQAASNENPQDLKIENAMYRTDIGSIDFVWGVPGHGKNFKKGYGISHIIEKRNAESGSGEKTANKLVDVIAKATTVEKQTNPAASGNGRIKLFYDGYTAVLSQSATGNHWLLTGWEDTKGTTARAIGEVRDSSEATTVTPILTRRNEGAVVPNDSIAPLPENVKGESGAKITKPKGRGLVLFRTNFLDKGSVFEDLSLKTKNRELIAKYDYTLSAEARAQHLIGNGTRGVKALNSIREEGEAGAKSEFTKIPLHFRYFVL